MAMRPGRWMAKIYESGARAAPSVFEGEQPLIAPIGTPHVKFQKAVLFGFLNGLPHQQLHRPQSVETRIGAPVLVSHAALVADREDAGCRLAFVGSQPDLNSFSKARNQVS